MGGSGFTVAFVISVFSVSNLILAEAVVSFLGARVQAPTPI